MGWQRRRGMRRVLPPDFFLGFAAPRLSILWRFFGASVILTLSCLFIPSLWFERSNPKRSEPPPLTTRQTAISLSHSTGLGVAYIHIHEIPLIFLSPYLPSLFNHRHHESSSPPPSNPINNRAGPVSKAPSLASEFFTPFTPFSLCSVLFLFLLTFPSPWVATCFLTFNWAPDACLLPPTRSK